MASPVEPNNLSLGTEESSGTESIESPPLGPSQTHEVGKRHVSRSKEKLCFVENAAARSNTLCKRKRTLFNKTMVLHVMTKAEVLIIIENGKQRYVCRSDDILVRYENEDIRPKDSDKKFKDANIQDDETVALGVCPLEDTPEKLDLDGNLAYVLGHRKDPKSTENRQNNTRCRSLQLEGCSVAEPVMQHLMNRPTPQLCEEELSTIDPVQLASKINFISEDSIEMTTANLQ